MSNEARITRALKVAVLFDHRIDAGLEFPQIRYLVLVTVDYVAVSPSGSRESHQLCLGSIYDLAGLLVDQTDIPVDRGSPITASILGSLLASDVVQVCRLIIDSDLVEL